MSSTQFSPESPSRRVARLIAEERKRISDCTDWVDAPACIIIDCIHWLASQRETAHTARDPKGVRFISLSEAQSDILWTAWYSATTDDELFWHDFMQGRES